MNLRSGSVVLASAIVLACGGDSSTGVNGGSITLSASQAAAVMTKIIQIAPQRADIAWLADSANLVLRSGAVAERVDINTDFAAGPFYAVGLQRAIQNSLSPYSTFNFIAFNDPSNPTDFVLVYGVKVGATSPPTSVSGDFGSSIMNAYLFHVSGSSVSAWRAAVGTGTLSTGNTGTACPGFQGDATVTCSQADLVAAFRIDLALADLGNPSSADKSAALTTKTVPGIILNFHF